MAGSFTVGALALARPHANAVGAVRLTLLPKRLEIELLRVGGYAERYVPGALTRSFRVSLPYTAVRGLTRQEDTVALTLDPEVVVPHNRFVLTHFTDLPLDALASVHKRMVRTRVVGLLLPAPIAVAVAAWTPAALAQGPMGRGALGLLVFIAAWAALRLVWRYRTFGGPLSNELRDAFEHKLSQKLGLEPQATYDTDPFDVPKPARPRPVVSRAVLARVAWGVAVCVALTGTVIALRSIDRAEPEKSVVAEKASFEEHVDVAGASPPPEAPPCSCERHDSPLWRAPLPLLTVITIGKGKDDAGRPIGSVVPKTGKRRSRFDFDVAIVNNGDVSLKDLRTVLTFARRNAQGERGNVTDRGLFWEGELGPGKSAKWSVEAPGTEYRIDLDEKRTLAEVKPAPADAFAALLSSRRAPVRLHAALMLAYLSDPRAKEAATQLSDLSESDEAVRAAILRASEPLAVCDVKWSGGSSVSACVANRGDAEAKNVTLVEADPRGNGRRAALGVSIGAKSGKRVVAPDFGPEAEELEARGE